ncbi:chaperone NapD [Pelagibacterium limicola]|uniref:chaperone NapD n=1 Tax=Pelagibacterium limicola TaxID=2791022 RepID=UPI0018AF748E|nr:chaperone NapD [Pelagibacterium limicola]
MRDSPEMLHISSALVRTRPERQAAVVAEILGVDNCEIAHADEGRIILIIEGSTSGAVGAVLTRIATIDDVISANLVYEQAEPVQTLGEPV